MLKKYGFYLLLGLMFLGVDFLRTSGMVTGKPPDMSLPTMDVMPSAPIYPKGPGIIYFWAQWCNICTLMQPQISAIAVDYPQITVALRSGTDSAVKEYMQKQHLQWAFINDQQGNIAKKFGVNAVPAVFYLNSAGDIVFTSAGYSTEWGMRLRLWLAGLL